MTPDKDPKNERFEGDVISTLIMKGWHDGSLYGWHYEGRDCYNLLCVPLEPKYYTETMKRVKRSIFEHEKNRSKTS